MFSLNDESLVKQSCLDYNVREYEKSWMSVMYKIQKLFGNTDMVKAGMQKLYHIRWEALLRNSDTDSKLRSYSKFKKYFKMENYVLQFPLSLRQNLTKLRISAHTLAIETGRYVLPSKIPVEKRKCFHCGQIEDEFHMIFCCDLYTDERLYLEKTLHDSTFLSLLPTDEMFCTLISCLNGDYEIGKAMCEFINSCFLKRSLALSMKKEKDIYLRPELTVTKFGRHSKRPSRFDI